MAPLHFKPAGYRGVTRRESEGERHEELSVGAVRAGVVVCVPEADR